MTPLDRREFLVAALCGAGAGLALAPGGAAALPLDAGAVEPLAARLNDDVQRAQAVVVRHARPRHRRWVCWHHRGRRVCGWRWV